MLYININGYVAKKHDVLQHGYGNSAQDILTQSWDMVKGHKTCKVRRN
jgi:hypothetical protein